MFLSLSKSHDIWKDPKNQLVAHHCNIVIFLQNGNMFPDWKIKLFYKSIRKYKEENKNVLWVI
jgi:hypothetical protein